MPQVHHKTLRNTKLYGHRVFLIDGEGRLRAERDGSDPTEQEAARFTQSNEFFIHNDKPPVQAAPKRSRFWPTKEDKDTARDEALQREAERALDEMKQCAEAEAAAEREVVKQEAARQAAIEKEARDRRAAEAAAPADFALDTPITPEEVSSSNIKSVGYFEARGVLEVVFNSGEVYRYARVSLQEWKELNAAPSKGMAIYGARTRWATHKMSEGERRALLAEPAIVAPSETVAEPPSESQINGVMQRYDELHHTRKRAVASQLDPHYETRFEGDTATSKARAAVKAAAAIDPEKVLGLLKA